MDDELLCRFVSQDQNLALASLALIQQEESLRQINSDIGPFFQHNNGTRHEPATCERGVQGLFTQTLAIGRVQKNQIERFEGRNRPQFCSIPPQNARDAAKTKAFDIMPQKSPRLCALIHHHAEAGSLRKCLQRQCACACKKIKNAGVGDGVINTMFAQTMMQHIENRFAQTVRCRADRVRFRPQQRSPLQSPCNDPHGPAISVGRVA